MEIKPKGTHFHGPQLSTSKGLALRQLCKDKGVRSAECGARKAESRRRKAVGGMRAGRRDPQQAGAGARMRASQRYKARSRLSQSGIAVE
jgi:hypothetical protein